LKEAGGGRLAPVTQPKLDAPQAKRLLANPYWIGDQPGMTQSSGWLDAWRSSPSVYAVEAESAADVVAAVNFARTHNLRLVVKGRGHSYLGTSNAPDSLLIWTRRMDGVTVHDAFTPQGSSAPPAPAVSCGGGAMWLHAYKAVSVEGGRYVQGGGCTTVGVAGLVQGGGFGSFSKGFGLAGASLLEAEIVTADGKVRVVNEAQEPELFWALKGGGGGSWGVITRLTLATHDLPTNFGAIAYTVHAHSDEALRRLIARFVALYAERLCNPHFGEQARAGPHNRLILSMVFQGLAPADARAALQPLVDFVAASPSDYTVEEPLRTQALPARMLWHAAVLKNAPGAIVPDDRSDATAGDFWWSGDSDQVGIFWDAYASAWLPASLLTPQNQPRLVDAWFAATRHAGVSFHFNKGLAGAPPEARAAALGTPMNPDVTEAFALAIIADGDDSLWLNPSPNLGRAREKAERVQAAMKALRVAAPQTGAYVNECDYFQPDWQRAFWGDNYARLRQVKERYDPDGLFTVHHGVGSEGWSADGFTRT
jgi:FAD/FMN-containing dehydrogenase